LWKLSWDNFTDSTPLGPKSFSNILWTFDPSLLVVREKQAGSTGTARSMKHRPQKHVVLAAHWDSKLLPAEVSGGSEKFFVGACDSAVPVAMVITLMHVIQEAAVAAAKLSDETAKFTVMLFDGEEAFVEWQGLDNTYGSRHLAAQWAAAGSGGPDGSNLLSSISLFILFDLLGPFGPTFRNFFPEQTGDSYQLMRRIETSLRKKSLLKTTSRRNADPQRWSGSFFPSDAGFPREVEDDHKPWRARNVSVLHLISLPFPSVWHTVHDDRQAVDDDTVHDLMAIFEEFVRRVMRSAK
jgi:glutaminyl-peptide cyclotransferase